MSELRCYVCGDAAAPDADPRNATCARCKPAREHVVSMQTAGAMLVAECPCGWRFIGAGHADREEAVHEHWRLLVKGPGQ